MQTSISYRGEFLYDSKDIQSIVGLKFQPRPDKYFLFEFVDEPVGDTLVTETTLTIDDGTPIKSKTVTRDDQFTLSIQFAKRLYDLNVRFGLMRSEGGFGTDYYLLGDNLELSFEAFDFSRGNFPHLRTYATYTLFKHLWLSGGVDDLVFEPDSTPRQYFHNYFLGAGLQFTDEDIKALAGSIPLGNF